MYIRKSTRYYKGKTYTNYLLVESILTPKGPRQKVICSLGNLAPAPKEEWLSLAHRLAAALQGQKTLEPLDAVTAALLSKVRRKRRKRESENRGEKESIVGVDIQGVETEEFREAGAVHVGHQMWRQLGMDVILREAGLSDRACRLSEAMVLNRLIFPLSEHAMPNWIRRTAMAEILGEDFEGLQDNDLLRNMDRLYPRRERVERDLAEREKTLFNLEGTMYLYDLTSTYFEGQAKRNPQAQRGYSRDQRFDCKQVVIGLVLDGEGFTKAHEVFAGNRPDGGTVEEMLQVLERRIGKHKGATVVVDRGMASGENLRQIRGQGYHYLVAGRQAERNGWLEAFEEEGGWEEVIREPSPWNEGQKKSRVEIKRRAQGEEVYILCRSEGREAKDLAIREKQEGRLLRDMERLRERIAQGRLKDGRKIQQAIGRLQERYPRVARYYRMEYQAGEGVFAWQEVPGKKELAERLDGGYLLKTDRQDLSAEEIWRYYMLLTRVESAFRSMKSPLMERPIFHHLKHRTQTHIFLCVLAYHLLVSIEKRFRDQGIYTSWWTLRQQLSTHQVVTVILPTEDGRILKIRKVGKLESIHRQIYETLHIPLQVMKPIKTWQEAENSD